MLEILRIFQIVSAEQIKKFSRFYKFLQIPKFSKICWENNLQSSIWVNVIDCP